MADPLPQLTSALQTALLYSIYVGIILATISGVVAGILFLPIFGLSEKRTSLGATALRAAIIGIVIILLAIPARNGLLRLFPPPAGTPPIPLNTPNTPVSTSTPGRNR